MYRRLKHAGTKGLIVRKTYPELLSNHIRMFFAEYPIVREWFNKSEKAIYWPNGSITEFSYLKSTDDVYTYQGREYEDISIDEITQHEELVFKILRSSNRTTKKDIMPTMVLTGNPGGIGHGWAKRLFIDRQFKPEENPEDFDFIQAKVFDNKALMDADPNYVKRLEDLPEHFRKAYLEGDWNVFIGQFFSEFRRDLHVCKPLTPKKDLIKIGGIDWGRERPFVFLGSAVQKVALQDGRKFTRVWTYKEIDGTHQIPEYWANEIKDQVNLNEYSYIRADPSMFHKQPDGSMSIADQMMPVFKDNAFKLKPANNDRIGGWAVMHKWLSLAPDGLPYWLISEDCPNLIRTLPGVVHDEHNVEDLDTDGPDDEVDSGRYMLMHLKWIDASLGAVRGRIIPSKYKEAPVTKGGGVLSIDTDEFAKKGRKKQSWKAV